MLMLNFKLNLECILTQKQIENWKKKSMISAMIYYFTVATNHCGWIVTV